MTSVTSTRELRPVPKMLQEMVKDPTSLRVMYHGAGRDHKDPPFQVRPHNILFGRRKNKALLSTVCTYRLWHLLWTGV